MEIRLSTATIESYENRNKSMNLHFHPIVLFENSWPFPLGHLKNVVWEVFAEPIGVQKFEIEISSDSPFAVEDDKNYVEFHLSKLNVPFQYDDYTCEIRFSAVLVSPHTSPEKIESRFWGVVKTIWKEGLQ